MSLTTPTTQQISDNIVAQIEASLSQSVPLLPRAFIRVLAKALSGVFILVYKYAGFMFLQQFVRTATIDETTVNGKTIRPLVEWGVLVGEGEPTAAVRAELFVEATVESSGGGILPVGTQLLNSDNGVTYITTLPKSIDTVGTVDLAVRAVSDPQGGGGAGAIGNLDPGDVVRFANPLAHLKRDAVVLSQLVTGADGETEGDYRRRIVQRFQRRPQGGAYADYRTWATGVTGIINAYPYAGTPGIVEVYVEATTDSSGDPDGIPTGAQQAAVEDAIEYDDAGLASRRPVGAYVRVWPITRLAFDVAVSGLDVSDPTTVQTDIEAALTEHLLGREPFIIGLSVLPRADRIAETAVAGVVDGIVSAAGGTFSGVSVEQNGTPVTTYTLGEGEKAKLGAVTYP